MTKVSDAQRRAIFAVLKSAAKKAPKTVPLAQAAQDAPASRAHVVEGIRLQSALEKEKVRHGIHFARHDGHAWLVARIPLRKDRNERRHLVDIVEKLYPQSGRVFSAVRGDDLYIVVQNPEEQRREGLR